MKALSHSLCLLSIVLVLLTPLHSQDPNLSSPSSSPPPSTPTTSESEQTTNTPTPAAPESSQPVPGSELIPKALQFFLAKKYPECIEVIDQILKINPTYTDALNLKGAAYTKMKNWQAAEASFRQALSASPMAFEPKFNLAELLFLQNQYSEARRGYTAILELANTEVYKHLTEFKIFLTHLLEDNFQAAQEMASKYDGFETTPIHYFTQGCLYYKQGNRPKAMEYFDSAARIFPARLNHHYADTLIELGWIRVNEKGMLSDPDAPQRGPSILKTEPRISRAVNITPAITPVDNIPAENTPQESNQNDQIKNPFKKLSDDFRQEINPE